MNEAAYSKPVSALQSGIPQFFEAFWRGLLASGWRWHHMSGNQPTNHRNQPPGFARRRNEQ
jgi:hypothetical protein